MHSERANETLVGKYCNGKQGKLSFSNQWKEEDSNKDKQSQINQLNAAFLKHQLQTNGIVLTKWSPDYLTSSDKQDSLNQKLDINNNLNQKDQPFSIDNLKNTEIHNSIKTMVNYNSINNESIDSKTNNDLTFSNCHINDGYVNSDAHSLEYNNDYEENQNSYQPPPTTNDDSNDSTNDTKDAIKELFLPVLLSTGGNMGAGVILDTAQKLDVFKQIPQLIVLVPALLGLKGNVEMTLSSRLGTCANLGELEDKKKRKGIVIGNVSLAQCQASTVGLIAPFIAIMFSYIQLEKPAPELKNNQTDLNLMKTLLILAASVSTSGLADLMLSSFMCFVVIISVTKFKINADNIATPIAASVGDLATMSLFSVICTLLYKYSKTYEWLPAVPITIWLIIISFTGFIARRNPHTKKLVYTGWSTLFIAMMIQNTSGTIMENFFRRFPKMTAFQPVINGFGGNLVAIQSSRIATFLHKTCKKRQLPDSSPNWLVSPFEVFFGQNKHGKLALILILMAAPLQFPFVFLIRYITENATITPSLLITYYFVVTVQVTIILYIGYIFVHLLWKLGFNPDNNSIPILTALADLIGSMLFALGFIFLNSIKDPNALVNQDLRYLNQTSTNTPLIDLTLNSTTAINQLIDTTTIASTITNLLVNQTTNLPLNLTNLNELINSTITSLN